MSLNYNFMRFICTKKRQMKKLIPAFIGILFLGSCIKNDNKCNYTDSAVIAPATEVKALEDSLAAHGITDATKHASGFFYKVNNQGTGAAVTNLCTVVTVTYKGSFFNGKIFDSTATGDMATFQLGQVIAGWQKGVPLVNSGGDINLYIPPSLGYGPKNFPSDNQIVIPGGSFLVFNVKVIGMQ